MYKIGEQIEINVDDTRADLDTACRNAYELAKIKFGVSEDGYFTKVKDTMRWEHTMHVLLLHTKIEGSMAGIFYKYKFKAWVS